jgi:hypothetical protein
MIGTDMPGFSFSDNYPFPDSYLDGDDVIEGDINVFNITEDWEDNG